MSERKRLAVVVSHPIQYFVPLYRALAAELSLDLHVLFASRIGLDKTFDPVMGVPVAWATDLTGGYSHEFLLEAGRIDKVGFRDVDNPSVSGALRRFAPDAVILHGYAMLTMLRALAWCRVHGVKAILLSDSSSHGAPAGPRRWAKMMIAPLLLRQYGAALTMSERGERHLASLGYPSNRMFRTPVMIDAGFWSARGERARLRAVERSRLGLAEDAFVVLYVGKLYPGKRVFDALRALEEFKDERFGVGVVTLLVAGDGIEREALRQFAMERGLDVRMLGFVNVDALPQFYAAADALVHPAESEQYGMVVVEAAVVGLPLILSDRIGAVGASSIARPDVNALVYPCADIGALSRAMASLRNDVGLRAHMGAASLTISADHSGPESVRAVLRAVAC